MWIKKLDRGADFISIFRATVRGTALKRKGKPPKESYTPYMFSGTQAEYAADCHISGALSEYDLYIFA